MALVRATLRASVCGATGSRVGAPKSGIQLDDWIEPSSTSEQDRQDRAQRMVQSAISAHPAFRGVSLSFYAKGSYPNNTNVRLDSDVDIVVECDECRYYDSNQPSAPLQSPLPPYQGHWTPAVWRAEVEKALVNHFGASEVDATGEVAIRVREKTGSRPSADIVPSFDYRLYWNQTGRSYADGSVVYKKNGTRVVNWPDQQLANGRDKNNRTGRRYKYFVRALKNAENDLCRRKVLPALPSYLMECLVYNVDDNTLSNGGLGDSFQTTLSELECGLIGSTHEQWVEPNGIKLLFHTAQKWNPEEARNLVVRSWEVLYR